MPPSVRVEMSRDGVHPLIMVRPEGRILRLLERLRDMAERQERSS